MLTSLLLSTLLASAPERIPTAERQVLLDLYQSTQGQAWINKEGWGGPEGSECEWAGIRCWPISSDPSKVNVYSIELSRNNLRGQLPASLASLQYLFRLKIDGNDISMPLPDALLQRWDAGLLDLECGGSFDTVDEIRLVLSTNVYCANEALVFHANGSVEHYRERCRRPKARDPKPYCEVRRATTPEFSRLSRFLIVNGFFDLHERPSGKGVSVDGGTLTITAKGPVGIRSVEVFPNGDDSLRAWSYEKVVRGAAEPLEWSPPSVSKQCPWR